MMSAIQIKRRVLFFIEQNVPSRFYEAYFQEFNKYPGIEFYVFNLQKSAELDAQLAQYVKASYSLKPGSTYWKEIGYIRSVINTIRPDVIHAHETIPAFYAGLANLFAKGKAKLFYHRHHSFYHNYKKRIMDEIAFLLCKKVICVSEFSKKQAAKEHPLLKYKLLRVYNGVKLYDTEPDENDSAWIDKIKSDSNYRILFLAKLKPRKGHLLSVDVIKKVIETNPGVTLYIAGSGELQNNIQRYIDEQGVQQHVKLTGSLSSIKFLLSAVDMVILPSESEAFSLTVLETLCSGKLLLASDLPSIREIIVNRQTGVLIDAYNKEEWVKEICYYMDNKNAGAEIALRGKALFDTNFVMENMADEMKRLYEY